MSVKWAATYPIVPGLGNLFGRLAFNSSHFLYAAWLDAGPFAERSRHLANGVLLWTLLAHLVSSAWEALSRGRRWRPDTAVAVLILPFSVFLGSTADVAGLSTDLPVYILGVVVSLDLASLLWRPPVLRRQTDFRVFRACFLCALGCSVKLSFAFFGAPAAALAFACLLSRKGRTGRGPAKGAWIGAAAGLGAILIPWAVRGVILSGYPAFPSTFGAMPVDWRVPESEARREARFIREWGRLDGGGPRELLEGWRWLPVWAKAMSRERTWVVFPLCIAGLSLAATAVGSLRARARGRLGAWRWAMLAPSAVCLTLWFLTAPTPRFAGAAFWVLAAACAMLAAEVWGRGRQAIRLGLAGTFFLMAWPFAVNVSLNGPGPDRGFHPAPSPDLRVYTTQSGLELLAPAQGDQCWRAPLPATGAPRANLRLRKSGSLSSGFVID